MIDCRWYALGWWHFERGFAKKLAVTHFSKGKVWLRLRSSCKFKILQFWKTTCLPYLVNKWPRLKVANLDVAILQPVQKLNQAAGDILLSCYAHCCEFRFDQSLQLRETNEYHGILHVYWGGRARMTPIWLLAKNRFISHAHACLFLRCFLRYYNCTRVPWYTCTYTCTQCTRTCTTDSSLMHILASTRVHACLFLRV